MNEKCAHEIIFAFFEFNTVILILCDNIEMLAKKKTPPFLLFYRKIEKLAMELFHCFVLLCLKIMLESHKKRSRGDE